MAAKGEKGVSVAGGKFGGIRRDAAGVEATEAVVAAEKAEGQG